MKKIRKTIFINRDLKRRIIDTKLKIKGSIERNGLRKAGQYCVQVYGDERNRKQLCLTDCTGTGMLQPISEDMQDFYELLSRKQYSDEWGLDFFGGGCVGMIV